MNSLLTPFISGIVFALGLGISGMTRPVKVIGFLDFFGAWDASLAFGDIAVEEHAGCMNGAAQGSPDGQKSLAVATSVIAARMSTRATCMPTIAATMAEGLPTSS